MVGRVTVGASEHVDQRILRSLSVGTALSRRRPGKDDGMNTLPLLQEGSTERAGAQDVKVVSGPFRHMIGEDRIIPVTQSEKAYQKRRDYH